MKKARIRHLVRKEPLRKKVRRAATNKLSIASVVVILAGIILIILSYNYTDVIVTPNVHSYQETVGANKTVSVLINQDFNLTENIIFSMKTGKQADYTLYIYNVYTRFGEIFHQYQFFREGIAVNNTVIHLSKMYLPQGQTYYLNITSGSADTFTVNVQTIENVTLVEHSARNLGAPGLGIFMVGTVFMAYAITKELDIGDIKTSNI